MIRDFRYIIKKVIIGVLIALILGFINVKMTHALVINPYIQVSGTTLPPGQFAGVSGSYVNIKADWGGVPDGVTGPNENFFVSVVLCRTWAANGVTVVSGGDTIASLSVQNTQMVCPFSNSPYNVKGKVTIVTFKKRGGGSYNPTTFRIYTSQNNSGTYYTDIQLLDMQVNLNTYADPNDYANLSTSSQLNDLISATNSSTSAINNASQSIQNSVGTAASSIVSNIVNAMSHQEEFLHNILVKVTNGFDTMTDDSIDEGFQGERINDIKGSGYNNGSVSDIILLPVTLINKVVDGLSSNSCSSFNLGSFYGTDIVLPCYTSSDVSSWLGSSVYTIIDLLMSFGVILGIRKLVLKIYNTIIFLKEGGGTVD